MREDAWTAVFGSGWVDVGSWLGCGIGGSARAVVDGGGAGRGGEAWDVVGLDEASVLKSRDVEPDSGFGSSGFLFRESEGRRALEADAMKLASAS